jgi:hypothetical protein
VKSPIVLAWQSLILHVVKLSMRTWALSNVTGFLVDIR